MSAHLLHTPHSRIGGRLGAQLMFTLRLALRRFRRAYAVALRDEVSRRNLRVMDDRMLADVGISRAQANFEADRRPWRHL